MRLLTKDKSKNGIILLKIKRASESHTLILNYCLRHI